MPKGLVEGILSFVWLGYGVHLQIAEKPFFLGSELIKHKATNWLFENISATSLSLIFLLLGVLFAYWSWREINKT